MTSSRNPSINRTSAAHPSRVARFLLGRFRATESLPITEKAPLYPPRNSFVGLDLDFRKFPQNRRNPAFFPLRAQNPICAIPAFFSPQLFPQ